MILMKNKDGKETVDGIETKFGGSAIR